MCLLIFSWHAGDGCSFSVAANRDERYERPATAIAVLQGRGPRILGGRDELAGGTWLAVNEDGVVAGLTNQPVPGGPDSSKRSRGALPLIVARHTSATAGVEEFSRRVRPVEYNQASLLVADREALFYLEVRADGTLATRELGPGIHVLENVPLDMPSPKVDAVRGALDAVASRAQPLQASYRTLLSSHAVPPHGVRGVGDGKRDPATLASCVHTKGYGTRSSTVIRVPEGASDRPEVWVADGPPCTTAFVDASPLWSREEDSAL